MRTLIWFCYFVGFLLVHHPVMHKGLRALKRGDNETVDKIAYKYVPIWCNTLIKLGGVKIEVSGKENIPEGRPCVYAANHRGLWDIPVMLTAFGNPIPLIAKIESMKIPLIRRWMELLHCLFLDRDDPRQGMTVINSAAELINQGYSVGIFPEGTRYKGEEGGLGTFLGGAFRIANKTDSPIVPVVIFNSRAALEGDGHFTIKPTVIKVHILPAIETVGMDRAALKALPAQVEELIREELKKGA